jgi:hypothetical protein
VRASKILCTLLLFGPLAAEASEATAAKDSNSPLTAVDSATGRDVHTGPKPANERVLAQTAAEKGAGAKDRDTGVAVAGRPATTPSLPANMANRPGITQQVGRANVDRLHSLLAAQARGRVIRQPVSHPVGSARPVPTLSALAIHSTNGRARAPGLAVVGGPVVGRGARNSSIDGTPRLRQKF